MNDNEIDKYEDYLFDLGNLLTEMAIEAKGNSEKDGTPFSRGYVMAFHRVISLMQQQAQGFGIELERIGLNSIDADDDLL